MQFEYEDVTYRIRFRHRSGKKLLEDGFMFRENKEVLRAMTTAVVYIVDGKLAHKYLEGQALCCMKDNFVKETGRKLSLTRALRQIRDKEFRRAAWRVYHERALNDRGKALLQQVEK